MRNSVLARVAGMNLVDANVSTFIASNVLSEVVKLDHDVVSQLNRIDVYLRVCCVAQRREEPDPQLVGRDKGRPSADIEGAGLEWATVLGRRKPKGTSGVTTRVLCNGNLR